MIAPGQLTSGVAAVDGALLSYDRSGTGPPLVFIHGSSLDRALWDEQLTTFAKHFTVVRFDARGHGQSASAAIPFAHHRDLRLLLAQLQIDQAIIIGLSMGGRIAQHFALAYPEMVRALVLVASAADGATPSAAMSAGRAAYAEARARGAVDEAVEHFLRLWVDGPRRAPSDVDPQVRQRAAAMALQAMAHPSLDQWDEGYVLPTAAQLQRITAPTLVMVGEYDLAYMIESAEILARSIAGAVLLRLNTAGHLLNLEQPAAFAEHILAFLACHADTETY